MKRILIFISVLAIMFTGYGQYYPTDNNKTTKHLPSVSSMQKPKPKPAAKPTQPKPATPNPASTQQRNEEYVAQSAEYQGETIIVHDTLYVNNDKYDGLVGVIKNMLGNSFMEMKLSNFSASRYTVGVRKNEGYAFLSPLPFVFAGQKSYSNSKECYENLDKVEYKMLGQNSFQKLEKSFVTSDYAPDFLMVTTPENFTDGGVRVETPTGKVNGMMIWFVKNSNNEPVDMEVEPLEMAFTSSSVNQVKQPVNANVIAGAFVGVSAGAPGNMGVTLYAMARKNNGKWELVKVMNAQSAGTSSSANSGQGSSSSSNSGSSRGGGERGGERGGGGR